MEPPADLTTQDTSSPWKELFGSWFWGYFVSGVVLFFLYSAFDGSEDQAREQRVNKMSAEVQEAVRRGEAGEALQFLYPDDHAIYLKRAKAGDPSVRPMDQDVYEYLKTRRSR